MPPGGQSALLISHRAVEDHAVTVALALDVSGQVKADGSVPDGVHRLGIKEVVRPRCGKETDCSERRGTLNSWRCLDRGKP